VKGYTLIYTNVDSAYLDGPTKSPTLYYGPDDSLRTLGYQSLAPNGDSLFAIEITYQVLSSYSGRAIFDLPYLAPDSSFGGAFIDGTTVLTGECGGVTPNSRGVSYDSMAGGNAGRIKWLTYGLGASGTRVWQKDTLYFSSVGDSVALWDRPYGYTYDIPFRQIFLRSFSHSDSWRNGSGDDSTQFTVVSPDTIVAGPTGTYPHVASISVSTSQFNLPISEVKFFARSTGLILQQNSWWATSDGSSRTYHITTHELSVIVKDDLEE
jgi:hypothetical protein